MWAWQSRGVYPPSRWMLEAYYPNRWWRAVSLSHFSQGSEVRNAINSSPKLYLLFPGPETGYKLHPQVCRVWRIG